MVATTFACRVLWRMWRLKRLPQKKCGADTMAVANCGCQPMPTKQALSFLLFFMWPQLVCVVLHLWAEGETIKYDLLQTLPHYENLLFYVRVDVHLCSMDGWMRWSGCTPFYQSFTFMKDWLPSSPDPRLQIKLKVWLSQLHKTSWAHLLHLSLDPQ